MNVGKYAIYRSYGYRNPFEPINVAEGFMFTLLTWILAKGKLTWQWKTQPFEHVSHVSPIKNDDVPLSC